MKLKCFRVLIIQEVHIKQKATSISTSGFHTNTFILFSRDNKVTINFATILRPRVSEMPYFQGLEGIVVYSNSIVPVGFGVKS